MKRIIFSLICASLVLSVVAEATRLDRSQLKQLSVVKTPLDNSAVKEGPNRQVVESRALTSVDNKSTENRTAQQSKGGFTLGSRIAKIDAYDFDWDDEQGVVIVNDSSCALMGKYCSIRRDTISGGLYLSGFLDRFDIPIQFDSPNELKIKAGTALDTIYHETEGMYQNKEKQWIRYTIYAMPLSWLDGTTDTCDFIHAVVDDDVITFTDDFAFMRSSQLVGSISTSWGLTPIYKNLALNRPNGKHQYWNQKRRDQYDPQGILDQPFGGREPRPIKPHPVNTTPIKPINPINTKIPINSSSYNLAFADDDNKLCYNPHNPDDFHPVSTTEEDEVYMYQLDDTTLMVYNLYGKDYCWNYMFINPDKSLRFPKQAICKDNDGYILYNCSSYNLQSDSTLMWGNQGSLDFQDGNELSSISWNRTYLCSNGGLLVDEYYNNTILMDSVSGEAFPSPNNLIVFPGANYALVVWDCEDEWPYDGDVLFNLRWRPYVDTSGNPINVTLPVDTYEDEIDGWAFHDYDGDGYGWNISVNPNDNSDICLYSDSYFNGALTPDNWLISPLTKLEGVCKFKTAHRSNYPEMMEVMIGKEDAIDGNIVNTDKFTTIATFETTGNDFEEQIIDLSAYNGAMGYVVFRHYGTTDQWTLYLDDIFIGDPNAEIIEKPEWLGIDGIGNVIEIYLTPKTTYEVQVQAYNETNQSAWTAPLLFTTLPAPNVYILGEVGDQNWAPNAGIQMTYEEGVYTATVTFDGRNNENGEEVNYFAFTKKLGLNGDDWATCNANRFGSETDGDFWVTPELMGQELGLVFPYEMSYRIAKGEYKMTVDLENMTLVVEKVMRGDANKDGEVNIKDVSTLIDVLLGIDEVDYNAFSPENADVNKDGAISIADVSALIDILLEEV